MKQVVLDVPKLLEVVNCSGKKDHLSSLCSPYNLRADRSSLRPALSQLLLPHTHLEHEGGIFIELHALSFSPFSHLYIC